MLDKEHDRRLRAYTYYEQTVSVCSECLRRVEAKIIFMDERVIMEKWCPIHGRERVLLADDISWWRMAREQYLKPAEMPRQFQTPMRWGCPYDCGLCPDHQQHACLAILEILDHCNLTCPVCFAESGVHRTERRSLSEVERMLDAIVAAEGNPDVVQISGGEPTLHEQFFEILDAAKQRPIRHLMVNTNGLRIANEPGFAARLAEYQPGFEVYLQFDSLDDDANLQIRGARLSATRFRALEQLEAAGVSTTLVATLVRGVNDHSIGELIEFARQWRCVRGVTLQPVEQAGRVTSFHRAMDRLTLTEVRRRVLEQSTVFSEADIVPVPCHPDAIAMAYAFRSGDTLVPLTGQFSREQLMAGGANTILFERFPDIAAEIARCFSVGLGDSSTATTLGSLLCCLPGVDTEQLGRSLTYENVFRFMIVKFMDAHDFDVRSAKKACIHFVQPDGRIIPFDTWNLFYRGDRAQRLQQLRSEVPQPGVPP
jgi:uncharacterized radical SAM superfamily Fe-S cluster-containing enzyme